MKPWFLILACSALVISISEHVSAQTNYPEGIYHSKYDFLDIKVDQSVQFRKVNLDVPLDLAFADTLVDRCFFIDEQRDPIQKVFAISHGGELYFQEKAIRKNLLKSAFLPRARNQNFYCYRVKVTGRYQYMEMTSYEPVQTTGGLLGAAISDLVRPIVMRTAIVFDTKTGYFITFNNCVQIERYIDSHLSPGHFECDRRELDFGTARRAAEIMNRIARDK